MKLIPFEKAFEIAFRKRMEEARVNYEATGYFSPSELEDMMAMLEGEMNDFLCEMPQRANVSQTSSPLISFGPFLTGGYFIERHKRFLVDVETSDGSVITAHCPNTGRMTGCADKGWPALMSKSENAKRKYPYTLELTHSGQTWICVNTHRANELARAAIANGCIPELGGYDFWSREIPYGVTGKSRIDLLGEKKTGELCYVEVKSVTMLDARGRYAFPDAPTQRGLKHLYELMGVLDNAMSRKGLRAVTLFMIMREDGAGFAPAADIDPEYAKTLRKAAKQGVEILAYQTIVSPEGLGVGARVDISL